MVDIDSDDLKGSLTKTICPRATARDRDRSVQEMTNDADLEIAGGVVGELVHFILCPPKQHLSCELVHRARRLVN